MHGWQGKVLRVDLTRLTVEEEVLDQQVAKDYIGGRGLGIYYLNKEVDPKCDPLEPGNLLVFATGPLTGTGAATGARYMIVTKSPLTGALTASNSGGQFPTEMKKAGYDVLLVTGKSKKPVYLWMTDEHCELRPADDLWGKDTHETTDILRDKTDPKAKIACIGPAGENKVKFAAVINDKHRAAGRSGVGAVMGSKNLKAIVVKGNKKADLFDAAGFKNFHSKIINKFKADSKENPSVLKEYGTSYGVGAMNSHGVLPTKNFQKGTYENWEKIGADVLKKDHFIRSKACFACPIGCGRYTQVTTPGFEGKGEGPEYETIYAFGSNCLVDNFSAVLKANYLCNELGIDTITMGATIACAMELNEKGYLSEKTIGSPLVWGDGKALIDLTRKTANREGFGDWLAEGSFHLAKRVGHPELAMVAKKQEFAGYDPRGIQGMGLAYATSPIGGSHMRGDSAYFELFGHPVKIDPFEWKGKAKLVKIAQDLSCIFDSAGLCIFFAARNLVTPNLKMEPVPIQKYLNAATGAEYSLEELQQAGERIFNAERVFLVNAGFSKAEDSLPDRITKEPMPDGPAKGNVCHLDEMLGEYYPERGWDEEGIPKSDILERLGLQL